MNIKFQQESDPLQDADALITKFRQVCKNHGVTTAESILSANFDKGGFLETLVEALQLSDLSKLNQSFGEILSITGKLIAIIEADPTFEDVPHIERPEIEDENLSTIKNCAIYIYTVARQIQPLLTKKRKSALGERFERIISEEKNKREIGFFYEFTDGDIDKIQMILNELRELISKSTDFQEQHRLRLLRRLERLQSEIHKKVSDLDRFWGLVGDAGVVMKKFGNDAKPIVDRIRELTQIVWKTQARAEELPSDSENFLLGDESSDE